MQEDVRIHKRPRKGPPRRDLRRIRPDDDDVDEDKDIEVNPEHALEEGMHNSNWDGVVAELGEKKSMLSVKYPVEVSKSQILAHAVSAMREMGHGDSEIISALVSTGVTEDDVLASVKLSNMVK